jgi:hypothetical protein
MPCACRYDFPLGDVVLEEALLMDKGEDGIAVSATHLTLGQQLAGDYEKVCVGTVKFGMRSTQVSGKSAVNSRGTGEVTLTVKLHLLVFTASGYSR